MNSICTTQIYTINAGFNMYHVTSRNLGQDEDDSDYITNLPYGEYPKSIDHAMYFGITSEFPYYYGANEYSRPSLKFTTKRDINLMYVNKNLLDGELSRALTLSYTTYCVPTTYNGTKLSYRIDGWIAFDDGNDTWREIYLFRPNEVLMGEGVPYIHHNITKIKETIKNSKTYPFNNIEMDILADSIEYTRDVEILANVATKELSMRFILPKLLVR